LDLCCGTGRALVQAAARLRQEGRRERVTLLGVDLVDLVDAFVAAPPATGPTLTPAPVEPWTPPRALDLITCVHGLNYVGDQLAVLARTIRRRHPGRRHAHPPEHHTTNRPSAMYPDHATAIRGSGSERLEGP